MEETKPIQNEEGERPPSTDDNPQQEAQLKHPSTDEPVASTETNTEIEQQQTINYKLETEDMEVHHHSHASHSKKNWKSYFWEFLMLFLAVFCGFLAEYQLEHTIEDQRERKYIVSLLKDLELDVESLNEALSARKNHIRYFDSLLYLLKNYDDSHLNDIYYYSRFAGRNTTFKYHDRTIEQLKGSGSVRLIKNSLAADSITIYDNEVIKGVLNQQEFELQVRFNIISNYGSLFNAFEWNEMLDSNTTILRKLHNPDLFNKDQKLINNFAVQIITLKTAYRITNVQLRDAIKSAEALSAFLKKEYHLK